MATEIKEKALHEFLFTKCKLQTMEFTKSIELKGNTLKTVNLRLNVLLSLMREVIVNIFSILKVKYKNLLTKHRKNFNILESKSPSKLSIILKMQKGVTLKLS